MIGSNPEVSIIVPVYNAGEYFYKCLETLVNQTLREIEIILVLDCPTDGTDRIAREYAAKDSRIIILENETNLHIGQTRNRGLEIARGEYIGFSDHDDYRELTMYEKLYKKAKSGDYDLVLGVNYYFDKRITITPLPDNLENDSLKDFILKDLMADGDDNSAIPIATNVHPNLYKTSFLKERKLNFVDSENYSPEDRIFQIMCLLDADKVAFVSERFYYHILHPNSAVNDSNYKSCTTRAKGKELIYRYMLSSGYYEKYRYYFLLSVNKEFTECLVNSLYVPKGIAVFFQNQRYLKAFPFCREAFRNTRYSLMKFRFGGRITRSVIHFIMKF